MSFGRQRLEDQLQRAAWATKVRACFKEEEKNTSFRGVAKTNEYMTTFHSFGQRM